MYPSNTSTAFSTLSRCATLTRSSFPTSAASDTDLGALKVASQPARCSLVVISSPYLLTSSLDLTGRTSCSPVCGSCPATSLSYCSLPTSPFNPHSSANRPYHCPRTSPDSL